MTGVSLADFSLGGTNTNATILSMTGDAVNGSEVFTVTVDTGGAADNSTIILNYNSANARDFAGNGGEFLGVRTLVATGETTVTVADFNGDGKADLLTGSGNVPTATYMDFNIRLGNGNGTFQPAQTFDSNPNFNVATQTAAADFNRDGKLDVAVTTRGIGTGAGTVSISFGNGDGTFQTAALYAIDAYSSDINIADFNNDGIVDIVSASARWQTPSLFVLIGNADGTFQAATTIAVDIMEYATVASVTTGDINGDGTIDLIAGTFGVRHAIFLGLKDGNGNATGTFGPQTSMDHVNFQIVGTDLVDLNGDGVLDLIGGGPFFVRVQLGLKDANGIATGAFGAGTDYQAQAIGSYYFTTGDVNADGKTDIVTINEQSDSISILAGNGDGTFQAATTILVGDAPSSVRIADFNGDGKGDILVTDGSGMSILINGKLSSHGPTVTRDTFAPAAPVITLTNDDGAFATDKVTTNGALTVTGVEQGATVEYSVDGGANWTSSFSAVAGSNTVRARQTDAAGNLGAASADFTFTLNRAPTEVALTNTIGRLLETQSTASNVRIADIQVTDDGVGTNTFGLTGADATRFVIVGTQLFLKAGTALNFTIKPFYDVAVTVNDALVGATPDDTSPNFRLEVENVNRSPTSISLTTPTVLEDSANGKVVGTLSAVDPDGAGTFTYTLLNSAGGRFSIAGNQLRVANGLLLDREQAGSHTINVRVTDSTGQVLDRGLTVTVGDVNPENVLGNASANTFVGGAGNDILDGGAGIDTLKGGFGNDTFIVDNAFDNIVELAGQGTVDQVKTSVSYVLGAGDNIEYLSTVTPTAVAALSLTGNELAQTITGNAGSNILNGKRGNDTLTGGGGNDTFLFDTVLNGTANVDRITDFSPVADTIKLQNSGAGLFNALPAGVLNAAMFFAAAGAVGARDATDRIIYNKTTGDLFYDADGTGALAAVRFAVLTTHPAITNADFLVI